MQTKGYCCKYPKEKNVGIDFGVSQRYYPGSNLPKLTDKTDELFRKLQF